MFSVTHLNTIRRAEIDFIAPHFTNGAHILEIGAGTGEQALELQRRGFTLTAIELASSNYAGNRQFPILDYDGRTIPLPDHSVDIVFSSNVLEHVPDLARLHAEIRRVLKPSGYCIHVMPTHVWRLWQTLTSYPDAFVYLWSVLPQLVPQRWPRRPELGRLGEAWYRCARYMVGHFLPRRHGERGNVISELWLFHPNWWRRHFRDNGYEVAEDRPMNLFYTGNMLLGAHVSVARRRQLADALGSACHLYKIVTRDPQP